MRLRALPAALGAACAAAVAVAALGPSSGPASAALLVELRPTATCDAPALLRAAGATTVASSLRLYRIDSAAAASVLPGIRACHALRFTSPDRRIGTMSITDFSDPLVPSEWWRAAVGVADLTPPGLGKTVTIVDTGVDLTHPEFVGRPNLVALNTQEPQPIGGVHGTEVASVVGASVNGVGVVGIYPEVHLQTWDVALGSGVELASSDIAAGILAAAATGPGVINLSVGSDGIDLAIEQAIEMAIHKGMLVVAAAGNDGENGSPLSYPASLPHVLTAAATDEQNQPTSFSSRSRFVDLAAPGQDIAVAWAPDDTWTTDAGTSFSSPLVAGAAAWVWTVRPELDASQLFEVMRRSATDIAPAGRDDATGFGLLSVPAALAYPAPIPDPLEPNDDVDFVSPGTLFATGIPALTTSGKRATTLAARVTTVEDMRDVYRVFVPAHGTITVKTTNAAGVDLSLWASATRSVLESSPGKDRLARGKTAGAVESVTYMNTGAAKTLYLAVTLGTGSRDATYRIAVAAR